MNRLSRLRLQFSRLRVNKDLLRAPNSGVGGSAGLAGCICGLDGRDSKQARLANDARKQQPGGEM